MSKAERPDTMAISIASWYGNAIENALLQLFWKHPEMVVEVNRTLCPVLKCLTDAGSKADPAAATARLEAGALPEEPRPQGGMCPPGTRECLDGTCQPCCGPPPTPKKP